MEGGQVEGDHEDRASGRSRSNRGAKPMYLKLADKVLPMTYEEMLSA